MILEWCRLVVLFSLAGAWWVPECGAQEEAPAATDAATLTALADAIAAAKAQPTNGVVVSRVKDLIPRIPTQMGLRESVAFAVAMGVLASGDELGFEVQRQKLSREYPNSPSRSLLNESNFDEPCPACKGEGKLSWKCPKCNGSGKCGNSKCEAGTIRYRGLGRETVVEKPCPVCEGKGKCPVCKGSGKESQVCGKCGGKGKRKAKGRARDLFVATLDQCSELLGQVKRSMPQPGQKALTPVASVPAQPELAAAPPGQPETNEETARTPEPVPGEPGAPAPEAAKAGEEGGAQDEGGDGGALPPPPAALDLTAVDDWLLPAPEGPIVEEPEAVAQATPPVPGEPAAETVPGVASPPRGVLPPPPPETEADLGKTPEHLKPLLEEYGTWLKAQQRRIGARIVPKVRVEEQEGNRAVLHIVLHKNFFSQNKGWRTQVGDAFCKLWAEKCIGYQVDGQQLVPSTILVDEKGEHVGE